MLKHSLFLRLMIYALLLENIFILRSKKNIMKQAQRKGHQKTHLMSYQKLT